MVITKFIDPSDYHTVEAFCSTCGRTITQYIDCIDEKIVYKENWETPTGWYHKSSAEFKCNNRYIKPDKNFSIKHFKTFFTPNFDIHRVEYTGS